MAIGGLASVLLALLWSGVVGPTWRTAQRSYHAQSQQNLALAWYETRSQMTNIREAGLWPAAALSNEADDELTADVRLDGMTDGEAPSWMTAAVFGVPPANGTDALDEPATIQRLEN
jgi:hypothetical protein